MKTKEEILELWNERAAIREYDGGYPRGEAEVLAAVEMRIRFGQEMLHEEILKRLTGPKQKYLFG